MRELEFVKMVLMPAVEFQRLEDSTPSCTDIVPVACSGPTS